MVGKEVLFNSFTTICPHMESSVQDVCWHMPLFSCVGLGKAGFSFIYLMFFCRNVLLTKSKPPFPILHMNVKTCMVTFFTSMFHKEMEVW